jgi:hypothetical protein
MPTEGMVHALHRAHTLLAPGGCLLDLRPTPETAEIEVGDATIGPLDADQADRRHVAAEAALAEAVAAGLFLVDGEREISFRCYGDSIEELREHVHASWRDSRLSEPLVARTRAAVDANPAATVRVTERLRLTKLRPR